MIIIIIMIILIIINISKRLWVQQNPKTPSSLNIFQQNFKIDYNTKFSPLLLSKMKLVKHKY